MADLLVGAVTVDDVAVALGRAASSVTDLERAQWQAWIDGAAVLIRAAAAARGVVVDSLDPDVVRLVISSVVAPLARRGGEDYIQATVSVDDANVSRMYAKSSSVVELSDAMLALLFPVVEFGGGGAWSVAPG